MSTSLSTWRAWIEILPRKLRIYVVWSLSTWRAWIEMPLLASGLIAAPGRSLHGERGLKLLSFSYILIELFVALYMESVD